MDIENLYKRSAQFYDGGNQRSFSEDIDFYRSLLKPAFNILDVGCGTGRVSLELLREDINITAFDLSDHMLDIFKEKLEDKDKNIRQRIELMKADMTDFSFNKKFDLIIFPFRVFQGLINFEQRSSCLDAIRNHSHKETLTVINVFDPNFENPNNFHKLDKTDYEYFDEQLNRTVRRKTVGIHHDIIKQTLYFKYVFELEDGKAEKEIIEDHFTLGYLEKKEADELFVKNGFTIHNLYAWWDRSPYDPSQKRELIYELKIS